MVYVLYAIVSVLSLWLVAGLLMKPINREGLFGRMLIVGFSVAAVCFCFLFIAYSFFEMLYGRCFGRPPVRDQNPA